MLMLACLFFYQILLVSRIFRGAEQIFFFYPRVKVLYFFFMPYKFKKIESKLYKYNSIDKILCVLNA